MARKRATLPGKEHLLNRQKNPIPKPLPPLDSSPDHDDKAKKKRKKNKKEEKRQSNETAINAEKHTGDKADANELEKADVNAKDHQRNEDTMEDSKPSAVATPSEKPNKDARGDENVDSLQEEFAQKDNVPDLSQDSLESPRKSFYIPPARVQDDSATELGGNFITYAKGFSIPERQFRFQGKLIPRESVIDWGAQFPLKFPTVEWMEEERRLPYAVVADQDTVYPSTYPNPRS